MERSLILVLLAAVSVIMTASELSATNGMNLEGYGPVAVGMGGSSLAYWNGTAAMMNNPATLSLVTTSYWLDVALGNLGPDVEAAVTTGMGSLSANSLSDAFYMPALGFLAKRNEFAFGLGIFSQGGMGTEYGSDSWMSDPSMGVNTALESGLVNRSEVVVGRVMVPFTYDVNENFSIGASVDFVWAGMDLQMAISEAQFNNMADPSARDIGKVSGTMVEAFGSMYEPVGGTGIANLYHAYFDFSNDSDFTGEAKATGFAGKIGFIYKVSPKLSIGATYHSRTALGDLETDNASVRMGVNADMGLFGGTPGVYSDMEMELSGEVTVNDFQWPAMLGIGAAMRPHDRVLIACDLKLVQWSGVMEDFKMTFTADDSPANGGFAGLSMDAVLFQNWDDQLVVSIGGAFDATEELTLRAGFNYGKNPIPDEYINALFPAIVESHITVGAGYSFTEAWFLNVSLSKGLAKDQTNPGIEGLLPPVESSHSQLNWMVMFSNGF